MIDEVRAGLCVLVDLSAEEALSTSLCTARAKQSDEPKNEAVDEKQRERRIETAREKEEVWSKNERVA